MKHVRSFERLTSYLRESLQAQLLIWVMVTLLGVLGVNLVFSRQQAVRTANIVTDNTLLGSARMLAEAIRSDDSGTVSVEVPPAALENFDNGHADKVYYNIRTAWGNVVAGYPELKEPTVFGQGEDMQFRNEQVRVVAINQPVVSLGEEGIVTVTVAVTRNAISGLTNELWISSLTHQLVLVVVAAVVTMLSLRQGLAPILRLRDAVIARGRERLDPLDPSQVQLELRPLVLALNDYMDRVQLQMAAQKRFVSNAAHQLRTPLALLMTQASFAVRESDDSRRRDALKALKRSIRQTSRLAEQLLTLARAEPGSRAPRSERVDVVALVRQVLEAHAERALQQGIDLGFETVERATVVGDKTMLREMVVNIVDNALRYTPADGEVTATIALADTSVVLQIDDSGPGISEAERTMVFERFYRISGTKGEGSGLGLAIVKEVIDRAKGEVDLQRSKKGGLSVVVRLPKAPEK